MHKVILIWLSLVLGELFLWFPAITKTTSTVSVPAYISLFLVLFFSGFHIIKKYFDESESRTPLLCTLFLMLLSTAYLLATTNSRQHDLTGHVEYVQFLIEHGSLPNASNTWPGFHPPVYYLLGGIWTLMQSKIFGFTDASRCLQFLSWYIFLFFLLKSLSLWISLKNRFSLWKYGLLFLTLPGILFFAARVNNDVLLPLWGLLACELALGAKKESVQKVLFRAGLISLAAILTKISGVVVWLSFLVIFRTHYKHRSFYFFLGVPVLALALWFMKIHTDTGEWLYWPMVQKPELAQKMILKNSLGRFAFDVKTFFTQINAQPPDGNMRESFPAYAIVTALQSQSYYSEDFWPILLCSRVAATFCLLLCTFALFKSRTTFVVPRFIAILTAFTLGFFVTFAWGQPYSVSQDFRYLAPMFFPMLIIISVAVKSATDRLSRPFSNLLLFWSGLWILSHILIHIRLIVMSFTQV